jgi:flagellum-specific peptidoglycan hydrolase FlgJ
MENKKLMRFVGSFLILPIITTLPLGTVSKDNVIMVPQTVLSQKENTKTGWTLTFNQVLEQKDKINNKKAEAIDAYFRARKMPLEGMGKKMVEEAEKNNLDWRLLAALAIRESTGGIHACKRVQHNFFGWNSCETGFNSDEQAVETIAQKLGGNDPNTDQYYKDKDTMQILHTYNRAIKKYPEQVMSIMNAIGDEEISETVKA